MWTTENRPRYDRDKLRYPSDLTPGISVSATIRAFSSADPRRRRPGPVKISTRRYPPFASSLTSNIRIARSPLPQPNQALPERSLNKGHRSTAYETPGNRSSQASPRMI